ncbi:MAG: 2-oxoacid:acceptor oxidoreductase subunit alpha, partial [Gammaproteobacteria bacterium]|nr:2-oxoacid:acceptor oxidoreductase subunit alpha [Gammaproteobacteria bacterium]
MHTSAGNDTTTQIDEHIVEIVSDSGEGAQRAGQIFGTISAKMGNGVWTVEIIPAEIKPPARSPQGASGIRIRLGSRYITNMGDQADLVVAFNEQVLRGRIDSGAYKPGTLVLLEDKWRADPSPKIAEQYKTTVTELRERGLVVHELAMEEACKPLTDNPRLGKNMFVLGMLCRLYQRDVDKGLTAIGTVFAKKDVQIRTVNENLFRAGYEFAKQQLNFYHEVPPWPHNAPMIVTNGNQAIGLGVMASGMELVSM